MKKLVLATAMGLALMATAAPGFAASSHSGGHPSAQSGGGRHSEADIRQSGPGDEISCANMLANPSQYAPADVRACE